MVDAARAELVAEAEAAAATPTGSSLPGISAFERGRVESLKKIPAEETVPAFAGMLVGADGTLWVREFRLPGEPKAERWFRMGPGSRWLASKTLCRILYGLGAGLRGR